VKVFSFSEPEAPINAFSGALCPDARGHHDIAWQCRGEFFISDLVRLIFKNNFFKKTLYYNNLIMRSSF
jgi:hypothetical protein